MRRRSRTVAVLGAILAAAPLAACAVGRADPLSTPVPAATTSITRITPTPSTSAATPTPPPPPAPPPVNPLNGLSPSNNGVIAVKIDDTSNGRPPVNLAAADLVYIEQVEGGLTRMMAVYNSTLPVVEPVRSTRANDPELAAQFGPIGYVASGGAPNPLAVLRHSPLLTTINDFGGPGFARDPNRWAPYNLVANLAQVAAALHPPRAKSIGLTWSAVTTGLAATPAVHVIRTVVGSTPIRFDWNPYLHRFVRMVGGAPLRQSDGKAILTPNVIVQFCRVTPYPADVDVNGAVAKYTFTTGSGKVVVFRDGHAVAGTWSRPNAAAGTTLTDSAGQVIPLAPGGAWVVLVATGASLTY